MTRKITITLEDGDFHYKGEGFSDISSTEMNEIELLVYSLAAITVHRGQNAEDRQHIIDAISEQLRFDVRQVLAENAVKTPQERSQ